MPLKIDSAQLRQEGKPLYMAIADQIEAHIAARELQHNEKLPATSELAKDYGVTLTTVQQALSRLAEKGLLKRSPKRGTFVDNSQSSRCVAIVFGFHPFARESAFPSMYFKTLERALAERGMRYACHFGLAGDNLPSALRRLEEEIDKGSYSCLLTILHTQEFMAWAARQRKIPCFTETALNISRSAHDGACALLDRGYRDFAFLSLDDELNDGHVMRSELDGLNAAFSERGLRFDRSKMLFWGASVHGGYLKAKEFFASCGRSKLPEAIFSHHDLLTKGLLSAASEAGLKIPSDFALLTHANKGESFQCSVPLALLEVDPEAVAIETAKVVDVALNGAECGLHSPQSSILSVFKEGASLPVLNIART